MGRGLRIFRWFCWKAGCGLFHLLNSLLALLAVLLTGLITLNSLQKEVPLPDNLAQWTMRKVLGEEFATTWSAAVFDLRGGLYLRDFRLTRSVSAESVLHANMIRLDFSVFDLLFGHGLPIDELDSTGVEVFISASESLSGLNETVLVISHAHLLIENNQLVVDYLNINTHGMRFYVSGSCPLPPLLESRSSGQKGRPMQALTELLGRIQRLPDNLDMDCLVEWSGQDTRHHTLNLFLLAPSVTLPMAQIDRITLGADLVFMPDTVVARSLSGQGILSLLNPKTIPKALVPWPIEPPVPITFSASGIPVQAGPLLVPENVRINLKKPFSQNFPVNVLIAESSLGLQNPTIQWALRGNDLFAAGSANRLDPADPADPDNQTANWIVNLRASLENPVLHTFFPDLPHHRLLVDTKAHHLSLHAAISSSSKSASGLLIADNLYIGQTQFSHLKSHFFLSPDHFNLTRIHVQRSANESAQGAYFQHLPSSRFSLNAYGSAYPHSLDAILGDWWPPIFEHIQVQTPLPADVTAWGQWGGKDAINSLTHVIGRGVNYREIPLDEMEVRVRSNAEWAYLEKLEGRLGDRRIHGSLAWLTEREPGGKRPMLMDLRSDVTWPVVRAASGVGALEGLDLEGNPEIHVAGVLWHGGEEDEGGFEGLIPDLRIDLSHRNATSRIGGWELSGLSLSGRVTNETIDLERISGTLAGGIFTGKLAIDHWQEDGRREKRIDLELIDADYREVLAQAIPAGKDSNLYRLALSSETGGGKIDTSMDLIIHPETVLNHGQGQITLRQANIGQIHLFGGLSRFFSGIGLGFSTLNLDAGTIDWSLEEGVLKISRCLLTGPVLTLQMKGDVDVIEKQLQLQAEARFFSGFMSTMLTPVSDNFQFDITGPLESPIWKLRLNPLRWFQNRLPQ